MKKRKSFHITLAIFIGLVLGILFGLFMPGRYEFLLPVIDLVSSLYMNALRMMIYPLVFCSLIVGIQGIGSISATGRVGGQSVLYYIATTLFASLLGLFLPKALGLGSGITIEMVEANVEATQFTSLMDTVKNLIPSNPIASFANGDMLQVLVFAILVGITCLALGDKAQPFVKVAEAVNEISVKIVSVVMYCTPVGVFCSIAGVIYANGTGTVLALGTVLIALYVTMFLYVLIVYGGMVKLIGKCSLRTFFGTIMPAALNGNGGSDAVGYGAAIAVRGNAHVTIDRAKIHNVGSIRTALQVCGHGKVTVNDSEFSAADNEKSNYVKAMSKAPWMLGIHGRVRTTTTDPDMGLISASDAGVWTANVLMFDMYGDIVDDPNFAITGTTYPKKAPDAPMMYLNEASVTAGGYTVTTDCHDVETCLRWIDYWYSEEGTFLANYGLEGVSFAYDENGNTHLNETILQSDMGLPSSLTCSIYITSGGPYVNDCNRLQYYFGDLQRTAMESWDRSGETSCSEGFPASAGLTTEEAESYSAIMSDIETYMEETVTSVLVGNTPVSALEDMAGNLTAMKIDEAIALMQAAYDRYMSKAA